MIALLPVAELIAEQSVRALHRGGTERYRLHCGLDGIVSRNPFEDLGRGLLVGVGVIDTCLVNTDRYHCSRVPLWRRDVAGMRPVLWPGYVTAPPCRRTRRNSSAAFWTPPLAADFQTTSGHPPSKPKRPGAAGMGHAELLEERRIGSL